MGQGKAPVALRRVPVNKKGSVVIFALLLVVALSILGVVLFKFGYIGGIGQGDLVNIPGGTTEIADPATAAIEKVEPGDDVDSIDKDLNNTNLNSLDQEVLGAKTESDSL